MTSTLLVSKVRGALAFVSRHPVAFLALVVVAALIACERYHSSATVIIINDSATTLHSIQLAGPCFRRHVELLSPGDRATFWVFPCGEIADLNLHAQDKNIVSGGYLMTFPHGTLTFRVTHDLTISVTEH